MPEKSVSSSQYGAPQGKKRFHILRPDDGKPWCGIVRDDHSGPKEMGWQIVEAADLPTTDHQFDICNVCLRYKRNGYR